MSHHIVNSFLSNIIPPVTPLPNHIQCISNCFTLQPLLEQHTWYTAYQQDSDTKLFIDHFSINDLLDQFTILFLPKAYYTALFRNKLRLLEDRLVYYEYISFVNKNICRIVVPFSLRHKIFNLMHATHVAKHMGES